MSFNSLLTFVLGGQPYHTFRLPRLHARNPHHVGALRVRRARNRLHIYQIGVRNLPLVATMIGHDRLVGFSTTLGSLTRINWNEKIDFTELLRAFAKQICF